MVKVTIGIPVYNGGATLRAALDSILAQSYRDFEVVISDNGSSDDTAAICREYAARNARVSYFHQPQNLGAAMNFRYVLFEAKSPYFMWAAADDLWADTFIERNLDFLETHPDYVMSQSRVLFTVSGHPSHLSTGTYAITGTPAEGAVQYFTNPADNSRYYGLFRTAALQAVFPPRNFHGLDWAVSAATLKYGKHNEIHDILMIRDSSDPVVYENAVGRDHNFVLWRIFPLLFMTRYILKNRLVEYTPRLGYLLFKANVYLHLRFGMYRWKRMGDLYVQTGDLKGSLRGALVSYLRLRLAPGMREHWGTATRAMARRAIDVLRAIWRRLPLGLETRFAVHKWVNRRMPWLASRLLCGQGWRVNSAPAVAPAAAQPPNQAQASVGWGWQAVKLPDGIAPVVSVVLVTSEEIVETLRTVDALARSAGGVPFEIVLVDASAIDVTSLAFPKGGAVRYLKVPDDSTYVKAANAGAAMARADRLVFIDKGMLAHEGFLKIIVSGLSSAAMVAPQVRMEDGRQLTAGGEFDVLLRPARVGYLLDPNHPSQQVARPTDFCPGGFAISTKEFNDLGGLPSKCATLEVASADLAVRLRDKGKKVVTRPRAALTATTSSGLRTAPDAPSTAPDWRVFGERLGPIVARQRWLEHYPLVASGRRKRVLYVDADTPTPDQNAGSIEAINLMRLFVELGYDVSFIPESNLIHRGRYTDDLQDYGIEAVWYPYNSSVMEVVGALAEDLEVVCLCRGYIAEKYAALVRKTVPHAKIVFNMVDMHFLRMQREAELANDKRLRREAELMRESEFDSIRAVDATIVVSSFEKELLGKEIPEAKVHLIPLVRDIPERLDVPGFTGRKDMMFVGTYQHPPNRDAVIYFVKEIFPLVRERIPDARFLIIGSAVTPDVAKLAGKGVEVLGYVEDLAPLMRACRISVAPLRYGAGIKGKVGTALEAGLPTVATTIAVEGTALVPEKEILVADKPQEFADQIVRLYGDKALWERLSVAGFEFVKREYSFESNRARIRSLLKDIDVRPPLRPLAADEGEELHRPSLFWERLQARSAGQLIGTSVESFKRTVNNSYFQWQPGSFDDVQVKNLMKFWTERPSFWPLQILAESVPEGTVPDVEAFHGDNPFIDVKDYLKFYAFFVGLLWYYVACHDQEKLHKRIAEPAVGNPLPVRFDGKLISQDLANSINEYSKVEALLDGLKLPERQRILEIGAGYGRLAYVFQKARPCQYVIVDISPARDIAQWYLSRVLPDARIFRFRPFKEYSAVASEYEAADICFLSPEQLAKLPAGSFDVGISVSSLHEMTLAQIAYYKSQLDRLVNNLIYFKQWNRWINPEDGLTLESSDYRMGDGWQSVVDGLHPIQTDFCELAFARAPSKSEKVEDESPRVAPKAKVMELVSTPETQCSADAARRDGSSARGGTPGTMDKAQMDQARQASSILSLPVDGSRPRPDPGE